MGADFPWTRYTEAMKRHDNTKNLDIDVRFLLANERTLLAWTRTGLALIAAGVALAFVVADSWYGAFAGIGAIVFGGLLAVIGYVRYDAADKAIRRGDLPPTAHGGMFVVACVVGFALVLTVAKLFS